MDNPVRNTILIVDDEPVNLLVLTELLRPAYRICAVNSGRRALRASRMAPRPDLILLDVMMPGMDGYSVLSSLRETPETRDIPVIFITALHDETDEEHGLELGAVDFITKPIKPAIVKARVRAQLELKRNRDRLKDDNIWLEDQVARRTRENQLIQDASLCALAGLAETRDSDTGNHTLRTQAYVEALARHLQTHPRFADDLEEKQLNRIVKAAPLHDIGKIGIPDGILLKPGPLTPDEFEIIKSHSRIGGEAIAQAIGRALSVHDEDSADDQSESLAFLEVARLIATSHHERWDGAGYPDGLAGSEIPLPARLMAVADVFDALISRRVYKTAIPHREARDIILAGRGSQFDPDITDAFVADFDKFQAIALRHGDEP